MQALISQQWHASGERSFYTRLLTFCVHVIIAAYFVSDVITGLDVVAACSNGLGSCDDLMSAWPNVSSSFAGGDDCAGDDDRWCIQPAGEVGQAGRTRWLAIAFFSFNIIFLWFEFRECQHWMRHAATQGNKSSNGGRNGAFRYISNVWNMYMPVTHIFGIVAVSMYWAGNTHKEHLPSVMAFDQSRPQREYSKHHRYQQATRKSRDIAGQHLGSREYKHKGVRGSQHRPSAHGYR